MRRLPLVLALLSSCVPYGMTAHRQEALARLCMDPQAAYEDGYNRGLAREPMNTNWVDAYCAPEYRENQRQAYLAGYQSAAQAAPVVYAPYGGAIAAMPAQRCELNSDGSRTCGYNCHLGSNGYHYCASTPTGQCSLEAGGTWACP